MSDFESFSGFNTADQMDEQSFEKFKEQIKANAAQIKALQIGEQKQKKEEDRLIKILLKFIKKHQRSDLVLLISRCLEDNIPAVLILSLILLGNDDVQNEVGVKLLLPGHQMTSQMEQMDQHENSTHNLILFNPKNSALPLQIKITFDLWGKNIYETCRVHPHKILSASFDQNKKIKSCLLTLTSAIVRQYLDKNNMESETETRLQFAEFLLDSILKKIEKEIKNQKNLEGTVEKPF